MSIDPGEVYRQGYFRGHQDCLRQIANEKPAQLHRGDARMFDGKWMVCTDPDMGRFVSFDGMNLPQSE